MFKLTLPLDDGRSHVNASAHRVAPTVLPAVTPTVLPAVAPTILPAGASTILPAANATNLRQEAAALPLERN